MEGAGDIGNNSAPIANSGTIHANFDGSTLIVNPSATMTNTGTLQASNGATLRLSDGTYTNTSGTIQALNGSAARASVVELNGALIAGGTLHTAGTREGSADPAVIRAVNTTSRLEGVTIDGTVEVPNASVLTLRGTITNNGVVNVKATANNAELRLDGIGGDVTLTGAGKINLGNDSQNIIRRAGGSVAQKLVIQQTVQGQARPGHHEHRQPEDLVHANFDGGTLAIDPFDTFVNAGTLQASNGATLRLETGTITNTGGLIQALNGSASRASVVELSGATIVGGTLRTEGTGGPAGDPAVMRVVGTASVLQDVTINGAVELPNTSVLTIRGTISNNGTIALNATTGVTELRLGNTGDVTLTGSGMVTMSDDAQETSSDGPSGASRRTGSSTRSPSRAPARSAPATRTS